MVLDADGVLDKQDLTIARKVLDEGRALVIAVNKWDIADKKEALQKLNDKLETSLTQAEGVPTVTISALRKKGWTNSSARLLRFTSAGMSASRLLL